MTTALTPGFAGFGAPTPPSTTTKSLQDINSRQKTFANKDFVKNIAWLNNSVDTLSAWSQKLQQGVDQANQNALEQVQGIWSDMFVMFAGLEPTGLDIGDVKYIIQGLGAFLGINPDTPFPVNLAEAGWHLFSQYIVPGPQYTDILFDAVDAWAVEFGLPPEFMASLHELQDAFDHLWETLDTNLEGLFDAFSKVLAAFMPSLNELGTLWDSLVNLIDLIPWEAATPVINLLADLGIPFIDALASIVNAGSAFLTPLSFISGSQIGNLGTNIAPNTLNDTTLWSVGATGADATAWVWDSVEKAFRTTGNGTAKEIHTQKTYPVNPGQKLTVKGSLKWSGIPTASNDFGMQIQWYMDANPNGVDNFNIPAGHGANGGFSSSINTTDFVVPQNVNGMRIAARVGTGITTGTVWAKGLSVQLQGGIDQGIINDLADTIASLIPFNLFDDILGGDGVGSTDILDWAQSLLHFGSATSGLPIIGSGQIASLAQNLLFNPIFATASAFASGMGISWDGTQSHSSTGGSAKFDITGNVMNLIGNAVDVVLGDTIDMSIWTKWTGLSALGAAPISLMIEAYDAGDNLISSASQILSGVVSPGASSGWIQLAGSYIVDNPLVKTIAARFNVTNGVTAGTVWFDDGSITKPDLVKPADILGPLPGIGSLEEDWMQLLQTLGGPTLDDLIARFQFVNNTGNFDAGALINMANIPMLLQSRITDLPADLTARVLKAGTNGFNQLVDSLTRIFSFGLSNTGSSNILFFIRDQGEDFVETLTDTVFSYNSIQVRGQELTQTMQVLSNVAVTPVTATITLIENWWNAEDWVWW